RQRYEYVPYALKIPVDNDTLVFNADGKLEIGALPDVPLGSLTVNETLQIKGGGTGHVELTTDGGAGTVTWKLPTSGQTNGYVLKTLGNGELYWAQDSTGGAP